MQVNFATRSWIRIGAMAKSCECNPDNVTIDMSLFLDSAHPRDRKLLRDCLPAPSSSDSSSGSESDSDEEVCSQQDDAQSVSESEDSTAKIETKHATSAKRPRSLPSSSQDSGSPHPPSKRRRAQPASKQQQQLASPHAMHPATKDAGLCHHAAQVKRGPGRPRKDATSKPVVGIRKPTGSVQRSEAAAFKPGTISRTRASHGSRPLRGQSAIMQCGSSRADRLAQRRHRQQLVASSRRLQQKTQKVLPVRRKAHQGQLHAFSKQPNAAGTQIGPSGSFGSKEQASLPHLKPESSATRPKPSRPQIVRSPFSFASQAFRSAAQLLSLRPRKISVPVCQGTRRKAAQKS